MVCPSHFLVEWGCQSVVVWLWVGVGPVEFGGGGQGWSTMVIVEENRESKTLGGINIENYIG